jgi:hypothetical protein
MRSDPRLSAGAAYVIGGPSESACRAAVTSGISAAHTADDRSPLKSHTVTGAVWSVSTTGSLPLPSRLLVDILPALSEITPDGTEGLVVPIDICPGFSRC